jgi:hypothetical protein
MAVTSARPTTPHPTVVAPTPVRAVGYTAQREATAPVVITVAVTPAPQPAVEPVFVDLRGPDGQLRRFPVVGGRDAIQSPTIVLHPGQSVNIQWVAAK